MHKYKMTFKTVDGSTVTTPGTYISDLDIEQFIPKILETRGSVVISRKDGHYIAVIMKHVTQMEVWEEG